MLVLCSSGSLIDSHRTPGRRGEEYAGSVFAAQVGRVERGEPSIWDARAEHCQCAGCSAKLAAIP